MAYCTLRKLPRDNPTLKRIGGAAAKIYRDRFGRTPAKMRHPAYGRVNLYPEDVIREAVELVS